METENSIAVQVWESPGKLAGKIKAKVRPLWYLADTLETATNDSGFQNLDSDSEGLLKIKDLPTGRYLLEVLGDSSGALLEFHYGQSTEETPTFEVLLEKTGNTTGSIKLPENTPYAWVQTYGLDYKTRSDSLGNFTLNALPPGVLRIIAWTPQSQTVLAEDLVQIRSDHNLILGTLPEPALGIEDPANWQYSRTLDLADLISEWMEPLQFPTVLTLRLDSSNFDFSQALASGHDLRITNSAGENLLIERARWSVSKKRAVVRIRLDDVSDTQNHLIMRWGRSRAYDPGRPDLWQGISDSLRLALNSVLLADFEPDPPTLGLPPLMPRNYWYTGPSENGILNSELEDDFMATLVTDSEGHPGVASHITYTAISPEWILIGTKLGPNKHSLATLDSIELWVRGDGVFSVALDNETRGVWTKARFDGTLSEDWTRIVVRPQDFLPGESTGDNAGWEAVKDQISHFSFFTNNGTELYLDDVRLYGVNLDDFN
jgi:hypothetical protein